MDQVIVPRQDETLEQALADVAGQLAPRSRKTYTNDARHFATWLADTDIALADLTRREFIQYRQHLHDTYAKATAARMLSVARRLCDEAVENGLLAVNPASRVRGFKNAGENETPHVALIKTQARDLIENVDRTTAKGKRDYALLLLLIRTGVRRSEAAALTVGDLTQMQGHNVVVVRHGKGDKRRVAKIAPDVVRAIQEYLAAAGRSAAPPDVPLFVGFRKGDHPTQRGLTVEGIEDIVQQAGKRIGLDLSPHSLRASFVTLALEGGAKLQQVQYAAGHADPRTTERYQKRKLNLDDNAADFVRF